MMVTMRPRKTIEMLTLCASVGAASTSGLTLRLALYHLNNGGGDDDEFAWGVGELATTSLLLLLSAVLFAVVWRASKPPPPPPRKARPASTSLCVPPATSTTCIVISFGCTVLSAWSVPNLLATVPLFASWVGWIFIAQQERLAILRGSRRSGGGAAAGRAQQPAATVTAIKSSLPPTTTATAAPTAAPTTAAPAASFPLSFLSVLANYLCTLWGFFGLTLVLSVVGFALRVLQMAGMPMEIRIAKGSARAFEICLVMCVLPAVERVLPYVVRWLCFLPQRWRIKDKHLHRRIVDLGNVYAIVHVFAHFSFFLSPTSCRGKLPCLSPYVFAWVSGYVLVWVFVLMYILSISAELKRYFHLVHRVGHILFTVAFLVHMPQIGYWLAAVAFLMVLDLVLRWCLIAEAHISVAEILPISGGGSLSHIGITTAATSQIMVGMVNIQILAVGKGFKPFTVFRLPGEPPTKFHCIIKAHKTNGWTEKLERAITTLDVAPKTKVYVDGPHATICEKHKDFSNLLLLASGVGITVVLSVLGSVTPQQCEYVRFEWSMRAHEVRTFRPVYAFLSDWRRISFPHLRITINVSGGRSGGDGQCDPDIVWLEQLAGAREHVMDDGGRGQGGAPLFHVREGRTQFDRVFMDTKAEVGQGHVGVFGCGSREYCRMAQSSASKFFGGRVSFDCHLEAV